jgi:phage gpG-like protein
VITAHLVGDDRLLAWLRDAPDAVAAGVARAIAKLGIDLQRTIEDDKLSGQVLARRSGSLASSLDLRIEQNTDAISASVVTGSPYARVHEYGFAGSVDVRASLRVVRQAFGRPVSEKMITVRAHARRMDLPERSFLRAALEEMASPISDEIDAALRTAIAE